MGDPTLFQITCKDLCMQGKGGVTHPERGGGIKLNFEKKFTCLGMSERIGEVIIVWEWNMIWIPELVSQITDNFYWNSVHFVFSHSNEVENGVSSWLGVIMSTHGSDVSHCCVVRRKSRRLSALFGMELDLNQFSWLPSVNAENNYGNWRDVCLVNARVSVRGWHFC